MNDYRILGIIGVVIVAFLVVVSLGFYSAHEARNLKIALTTPGPQTSTTTPAASALAQVIPSPSVAAAVLGTQTKTTDCQIQNGLPDTACTPGAILPNVTRDQVCQLGYASSVRNVPTSEKDHVYREYGITSHPAGSYEVDHLISLELGGSNDIANLWPEAADPRPGYHEKDKVENYLHKQVCNGQMSLQDAQQQIATNWLTVYAQTQASPNTSVTLQDNP